MYHIKLIKSRSYTGIVEATRQKPDVYVEDKATANIAVATGYFKIVNGDGAVELPCSDGNGEQGKTLEKMNKSELETFAAYRDVDIKEAKTKAEIIAKLREVLPAEELDGKISNGSPVMTELQNKY